MHKQNVPLRFIKIKYDLNDLLVSLVSVCWFSSHSFVIVLLHSSLGCELSFCSILPLEIQPDLTLQRMFRMYNL